MLDLSYSLAQHYVDLRQRVEGSLAGPHTAVLASYHQAGSLSFTSSLVEALGRSETDLNGDGEIDVSEVHAYIEKRLSVTSVSHERAVVMLGEQVKTPIARTATETDLRPAEINLAELRENFDDLMRRLQSGDRLMILGADQASAVLGPSGTRTWRSWDEVADIFTGPAFQDWSSDKDALDNSLSDPWTRL